MTSGAGGREEKAEGPSEARSRGHGERGRHRPHRTQSRKQDTSVTARGRLLVTVTKPVSEVRRVAGAG